MEATTNSSRPVEFRTVKSTGHKVWCTNGRRPVEFRTAAETCSECSTNGGK